MQTKSNRNKELRHYFWCKLKQDAEVTFKSKNQYIHSITGKVVIVRKTSVRIIISQECKSDIGFRNILYYE